nr:MAG TPA: EutP [Crassvirales sp.]
MMKTCTLAVTAMGKTTYIYICHKTQILLAK